jgi:DeoR/GlpR family transcriptional regulator of sugar metabolism
MLQSQRQEQIIKYLNNNDFLSVSQAVDLFDSSPATINRDFKELAQKMLIERVHGGIRPIRKQNGMLPFAFRQQRYSIEKEILAKKAVSLLEPEQVIFIDGGTTTFHIGMCLPDIPLHIITNSLMLAVLLEEKNAEQPNIEVSLTGGYLHKQSGILLGPNTNSSIAQYHAHWAFLSVGGIDRTGIYNTNELVTETERTMIKHAKKTVILADYSKIGIRAMCSVCSLDNIDILITNDREQNHKILDDIAEKNIQTIKI